MNNNYSLDYLSILQIFKKLVGPKFPTSEVPKFPERQIT